MGQVKYKYFALSYSASFNNWRYILITYENEVPYKLYEHKYVSVDGKVGWVTRKDIPDCCFNLTELANYQIEELTKQEAFAELL